jgi:hypothetical protein
MALQTNHGRWTQLEEFPLSGVNFTPNHIYWGIGQNGDGFYSPVADRGGA